MKLASLIFTNFIFAGLTLFADADHSAEMCSAKNRKVCGHIGHMSNMKPNAEAEFVAHMSIPKKAHITDVQISLWMPEMKHGSTPVTMTAMDANKYKVTKAVFNMAGKWEVRIKFRLDKEEHELIVPVEIKQ